MRAERRRCSGLDCKHVVDDDLDGPRLQDVGDRLADDRHQRERQGLPVRPHEVGNVQARGSQRHGSRLYGRVRFGHHLWSRETADVDRPIKHTRFVCQTGQPRGRHAA